MTTSSASAAFSGLAGRELLVQMQLLRQGVAQRLVVIHQEDLLIGCHPFTLIRARTSRTALRKTGLDCSTHPLRFRRRPPARLSQPRPRAAGQQIGLRRGRNKGALCHMMCDSVPATTQGIVRIHGKNARLRIMNTQDKAARPGTRPDLAPTGVAARRRSRLRRPAARRFRTGAAGHRPGPADPGERVGDAGEPGPHGGAERGHPVGDPDPAARGSDRPVRGYRRSRPARSGRLAERGPGPPALRSESDVESEALDGLPCRPIAGDSRDGAVAVTRLAKLARLLPAVVAAPVERPLATDRLVAYRR